MSTIVTQGIASRISLGTSHIFYHYNDVLDGIFIIHMYSKGNRTCFRLWKEFLARTTGPIYFNVDDPSYIGNHCKFHGNYGGKKVYQYVR